MAATLKEYCMRLNDYGKELEVTQYEALSNMILNILVNEPGFIPDYPNLGIGINRRRHILESDINAINSLRTDIDTQLKFLFPDLAISSSVDTKQNTTTKETSIEVSINVNGITDVNISYLNINTISMNIQYKNYNA